MDETAYFHDGTTLKLTTIPHCLCIMYVVFRHRSCATAIRLAELEARVIALSRTQADVDLLKKEIPPIETCCVDVSDWDKTRSDVEQLGPIDLLVNNAGITDWTNFLDVTKEQLYNVHDINFKAAFNISQVVARGMVSRGTGGAIVNVSSICGFRTAANHSAYCTSKAALDMLSSTMAMDLGKHNIRVNSVNPGVVLTAMGKKGWGDQEAKQKALDRTPMGRFSEESEEADAIVYLLSDRASMITGSKLAVDGGMEHIL